jgi:hypothetical protein
MNDILEKYDKSIVMKKIWLNNYGIQGKNRYWNDYKQVEYFFQ